MEFMLAQLAQDLGIKSPLDLLVQFGMASVIVVETYFFLTYIRNRDARDERITVANANSQEKVAVALTDLVKVVQRLDTHAMYLTTQHDKNKE